MILRKFDEEMFEMSNFDISNVLFDWEYYYKQYKKVLCFLACNENVMGIRFMSFLFVFRHTVELFLKKQMSIQKTTHSLNELFKFRK